MDEPELQALAVRQLADYDRHDPGTAFTGALDLSIEQAYRVQSLVADLRTRRGEKIIGWKVGCTSPVIRQRLRVDNPVFARLFESETWPTGTMLPQSQFAGLAIEGELAIRLGSDLVPGVNESEIAAAIEYVFPVIELHNLTFRGEPSAGELIANNAIHAGFVFEDSPAAFDPRPARLHIELEGTELATVEGLELTQTVLDSLSWLATELPRHGESLEAGQTVLCGSVADLFPIADPGQLRVTTDRFGSVECSFAETACQ